MNISVVVGNPKKGSRTLQIAEGLASRISNYCGVSHVLTLDLAEYAERLFRWPDEFLAEQNRLIAKSDVLVVASPTYKASYTGMLKAFLDRYPNNGLLNVIAIPVMTVASPDHALAVEMTLRPLLVELGAVVPTRGLCFNINDMSRVDEVLDEWVSRNLEQTQILERLANLGSHIQ